MGKLPSSKLFKSPHQSPHTNHPTKRLIFNGFWGFLYNGRSLVQFCKCHRDEGGGMTENRGFEGIAIAVYSVQLYKLSFPSYYTLSCQEYHGIN
ncbi:MAG TPA: hypothetical protein DDW51_03500 [Cyanobacteria bacterium UBA11367]|nr:hypothetical protein [Cyanobacteria bacterium UBA11367]HCA95588.1 hypothetical protein [Cyanobacteria bacterium UBA9226]